MDDHDCVGGVFNVGEDGYYAIVGVRIAMTISVVIVRVVRGFDEIVKVEVGFQPVPIAEVEVVVR